MKNLLLSIVILGTIGAAQARTFKYVDSLGSSPKGRIVAIEVYGHNPESKKAFSSIRFMNVWSKTYVGKIVKIEQEGDLESVRAKAKLEARPEFARFQIRPST